MDLYSFWVYLWMISACLIKFSSGCNELLSGDSGTFTSPNYPNLYSPNSECLYTVTPTSQYVTLTLILDEFSTETYRDGIIIYDLDDNEVTSLSGSVQWWVIRSLPGFKVLFASDGNSWVSTGFTAHWIESPSSVILHHRIAMAIGCGVSGQFRRVHEKTGIKWVERVTLPDDHSCMLLCHNVYSCQYLKFFNDESMCELYEDDANFIDVHDNIMEKVSAPAFTIPT